MIRKIDLTNFKNFKNASLSLGPLSLLVGANASGKSNLRDAFRFLHGISREYALSEIIGEKWIEGGVLQWKGIRGGTREVVYQEGSEFTIKVSLDGARTYAITVDAGSNGLPPRVTRESLSLVGGYWFDSHPPDDAVAQEDPQHIFVRLPRGGRNRKLGKRLRFLSSRPVLSQIGANEKATREVKKASSEVMNVLKSMRFLDLAPDATRIPSIPGQPILGDRGENLSSVLQAICADETLKAALVEWIQELTPLDVEDLEFIPDQTGKVLLTLVESGGQKTSAYSASDGTLRFLAMIAALLGPSTAQFHFFEELENGIHPTRLHLLLQLIEQTVKKGKTQVVATTHSPQLLSFLSLESREHASFVYRLEGRQDAGISRIMELPQVRKVLETNDLATLLASGWLEDAVSFDEPPTAEAGGKP